eukprot:CAMPEP_0168749694 /NCGR_PEP_ID=MMETSP0724-20121128/16854_1 /TAXON_ID=265536 /ORGANISM="Amphiprora sp., Strain CCMP467" /LENGTH=451 /DNA_ID=CAMNT_0008797623 /DNA_START=12 /DNA_END=1363 /DNA_ORIENTATION=-
MHKKQFSLCHLLFLVPAGNLILLLLFWNLNKAQTIPPIITTTASNQQQPPPPKLPQQQPKQQQQKSPPPPSETGQSQRRDIASQLADIQRRREPASQQHASTEISASSSFVSKATYQQRQRPAMITLEESFAASNPLRNATTTMVGANKKIISFGLFAGTGKFGESLPPWLENGVFANIRGYKFYFPDWICRFYIVTKNMPVAFMNKLRNYHIPVEIEEMKEEAHYSITMMQRFIMPFDDPEISHFMVRDLDSRPSIRELLAVNEWLASDKHLFHAMRDHRAHSGWVPIVGCCWGAKRGALGDVRMTQVFDKFRTANGGKPMDDQVFLRQYVWPLVKQTTMTHDSQGGQAAKYCREAPDGCRPYPFSMGWDDFHLGHPFKTDHESGRSFLFDQYHCFSTCHMAEFECTCKAQSYKMHHRKNYILGPNDWQMQTGREYPADFDAAIAAGTLS